VTTATVSPNATAAGRAGAWKHFDARRAAAGRPLAAVTGAEIQAPLIHGGHVRYANLDYGASAPALSVVSAYLNEILPFYASVHRGAGYASQISTSVYENARDIVRGVRGRPRRTTP
jgi:selenocysteine lyase/cysteine desulfurase